MAEKDDITALYNEAIMGFEALLDDVKSEQPPEQPLACRAGCDHYCYQPEITVTAVETFRLAEFITENFDATEVAALINALEQEAEDVTQPSWPLAPCSLLKDGHCSVYQVRPLACRGFNAYVMSDCEDARQDRNAHAKVRY